MIEIIALILLGGAVWLITSAIVFIAGARLGIQLALSLNNKITEIGTVEAEPEDESDFVQ